MTSANEALSAAEPYCPSIAAFEAADIDPAKFNHQSHVYVGWCYLQESSLLEAITRFTRALRHLTAKIGADQKYNETISWFFLVMIAERLKNGPDMTWTEFRHANQELCDDCGGLLRRYYPGPRLQSAAARELFLLPDRT